MTIHFDTTTRSSIDRKWPSCILIFSDGQEFRLKPLFFAYKNHQQISELLNPLSIATTAFCGFKESPSDLRQKNDAIMTDAATKNLQIENSVASELNSQHKLMHLPCKSYTPEALDRSNSDVLAKIEKQVNQHGTLYV